MDFYADIDDMDLDDLEILEVYDDAHIRQPNRERVRANPFETLTEDEFRYKYRFSKAFTRRIIDLISHDLPNDPRGASLSPDIQVACALRSWARHEIQDDNADLHGILQPAVSNVCKNVAEALAKLSSRFIKMPVGLEQQERTMEKFQEIANFPTVIGAIDCTHIRVKKINTDDGQTYINRKGYASFNVQVVCNADLKIMDIVAKWRGSVHDSRIFRESRLKQRFEAGAFQGVLLGDSGYPCTHYLFTPLLNPATPQEERYNRAHISTRNTVERCFGVWKQRFRCLLRGLFCSLETAKKTIVACAVLHNIALDMKEDLMPELEGAQLQQDQIVAPAHPQNTVHGNARRRLFIHNNF